MEKKPFKAWWSVGLKLFAQISGWIVFPILVGIYLGQWLDKRYNSEPWLFLICVGAAFIITNVGIVYQAKKSMNEILTEAKKAKEDQKTE